MFGFLSKYALPLTALAAFVAGWTVNGWRLESFNLDKQLGVIRGQIVALDEKNAANRKHQTEIDTLRNAARNRTRNAYAHANNPDRSCSLPADLVQEHDAAADAR